VVNCPWPRRPDPASDGPRPWEYASEHGGYRSAREPAQACGDSARTDSAQDIGSALDPLAPPADRHRQADRDPTTQAPINLSLRVPTMLHERPRPASVGSGTYVAPHESVHDGNAPYRVREQLLEFLLGQRCAVGVGGITPCSTSVSYTETARSPMWSTVGWLLRATAKITPDLGK
jgi:hypothetical protein